MLTMRSGADDLTTRARIRDAAIVRFSERGFDGTSLRQIAQDAGVSPALILHHFGSKEGLRDVCDAHVVSTFLAERDGMTGADAARLMREALDSLEGRNVALDYLARMLLDDSAASDHLFDMFLASTRDMLREQIAAGTMREQSDLEATAVYMTLYGLGPVILRRHLARAFGESTLTTSLLERSTVPVLELYTHGLYADDHLLVAAKEALARSSGPSSDKGRTTRIRTRILPADEISEPGPLTLRKEQGHDPCHRTHSPSQTVRSAHSGRLHRSPRRSRHRVRAHRP